MKGRAPIVFHANRSKTNKYKVKANKSYQFLCQARKSLYFCRELHHNTNQYEFENRSTCQAST